MIKSKKQKLGIEIDLTGPDGNAFVLIGTAGNGVYGPEYL